MRVIKRTGHSVAYNDRKIYNAIISAMRDTILGEDSELAEKITQNVTRKQAKRGKFEVPVEEIQDLVETELMICDRKDVAKAYILYRDTANKKRKLKKEGGLLTDEFISKYKNLPSPMTELGQVVYYRTYSRYLPELGRREYWWETVRRSVEYNCSLAPTSREEAEQLFDNVFFLRQFLSGRTLWIGGTDVATDFPMSNFNCSFEVMDNIDSFSELLYLLLLGSGVGLRLLKSDVENLPKFRKNYTLIHEEYVPTEKSKRIDNTSFIIEKNYAKIKVGDSKNGWVDALKYYLAFLTEPQFKNLEIILINYNDVRPMGEKLKTFGGRASGHDALKTIFIKIDKLFKSKIGDNSFKLKTIDCLDIANIIGEGVIVGGTRRTAEILLFDSDDLDCINAKSNLYTNVNGEWKVNQEIIHRQMSNNSIYYKEKPSREKWNWHLKQMRYSGEPAFVNEIAGKSRRNGFNGVNPCAEILLDDRGMCNLTTLNVMAFVNPEEMWETGVPKVDLDSLFEAQRLSVRAGLRMSMVDFELPNWNKVQKRDRLVGCSLTGWQDLVNKLNMSRDGEEDLLGLLKNIAKIEAKNYSKALGINEPLLVTTVKPEGTLSQLPTVSSGVHHSHSEYYIRRIRINSTDPIVRVCQDLGYSVKPEVGQDWETCTTKVVEFPVKAPKGKTKNEVSAIEQLENYKLFMEHYVDHNCSITVHVKDDEWDLVEQWVWDNWDWIVAVSFIPLNDSFYKLMPYESITEEEYIKLKQSTRPFIPVLINKYEVENEEYAIIDDECANGVCPIK